ncbi:MAG: hypothetical protein R3281_01455 [Balneolaceae bacterium]|nr:hypothetical protein [Balneolaceae bacterium]
MQLSKDLLKKMIRMVKMTKPNEIGCDDCFEDLHEFAELELAGKSPEEAMPLVRDHLDRCGNCREEYEALLEAMQSIRQST